MMNTYLSIGSNVGEREKELNEAYGRISTLGNVRGSHIYRTEPWGRKDLAEFLNACICLETELPLGELFHCLEKIEKDMGRGRKEKWEPRIIDIDILLFGNLIFKSPYLEVPHKFLRERRFYLLPLNEIAQDVQDPLTGKKVNKLLKECKDNKKVWKIGTLLQLKA